MPLDMLDRLILDPGTRTLGELLQEREWAVWEIRRLRADVGRFSRKREALRIEGETDRAVDPALNAQRLLRLSEVSTMIGLGRSCIYNFVAEGTFPVPIKVGGRSVRWKLADVLAWLRAAGFAMLIGATLATEQQALAAAILFGLSFAAMGGSMVPLLFFPPLISALAHITPHAWANEALTALQREGNGLINVLPDVGALACFALLTFSLAVWRLHHDLTH